MAKTVRSIRRGSAALVAVVAAMGCAGGESLDEEFSRVHQEVTATSRVLVNQIGYVANSTKVASVTGSGCNGKAFSVRSGGTAVFTGTTGAAATDPGSGETVCKANFTTFTQTGTFTLQVDGVETSDPFVIAATGADLYPQSLYENAVYYFTYHRLGQQTVSITLPGSKGTNLSRNWSARANTTLNAYNNWTSGTFNIDGGHMDAGDFGIYADSAVHAMWSLMNLVELKNPNLSLTKLPETTKDLTSEIIYGTRFFNGLLPSDTSQLASHKCHDHSWATQPWGYTGGNEANRSCMGPSSTATYAVARGLAQLVRVAGTRLGSNETVYWDRAKAAWTRVQGKDGQVFNPNNSAHSPGFAEGGGPYNDASALDDRFAAAVELYLTQKARGETLTTAYLNTVNSTATDCRSARCLGQISRRFFDWEHDFTQGNLSLMAYHLKVGGSCTSSSCTGGISADVPSLHLVRNGIVAEADNILSTISANGFPTPIAGNDYPWGSNKVVAHAMMILGYAHRVTGNNSYLAGIHQSLDYLLGQNTLRLSFITGYGTRFERATHDRQANGNSPLGWLSGGPINAVEVNDPVTPMHSFGARNYALNEADFGQAWCSRENTVDWNGPLSWVAWYVRNPGGNTCTPATCSSLGAQCGSVSDGCGGTLSCGSCGSGQTCSSNQCVSSGSTPYGGTNRTIPGTIEAEHYDVGGQNVAYNDTTAGNTGGALRSDDVDVQATTDTGGGHNVGWIAAGEWLNYKVNVTAGTYNLEVRLATPNSGRRMRVELDGTDISGTINVPNTGGTQVWTTVTVPNITLSGGSNRNLRLQFIDSSFNINWVRFVAASSCTPATCSSLGAQCGSVSDGCGGTLSCGSCGTGQTCSNNQCVSSCTPATCSSLGAQCGSVSDGCGGTLSCGSCGSGQSCSNNQCVASGGEPCTPQRTFTAGETNSGSFDTTGPFCFRTTFNIAGWGCSNFDGRTLAVNGSARTCGSMPLPTKHNNYYYFNATGGSFSWASIYWW